MIIQSLPGHLASFASGQLATARLYSPTQTIDPDILISLIIEESERRNHKDTRNSHNSGNKHHNGDEALSMTPGDFSGWGQGHGRGWRQGGSSRHGRQCPPCWNCGSREHFKADCKEPDKSAEKTLMAVTIKGYAHTVADMDSEDDGIFAVDTLTDPNSDLPNLLSMSDSDSDADECKAFDISDSDWFSEVGDDEDLPWHDDSMLEHAAYTGEMILHDIHDVMSKLMRPLG
jgi:hypothetical protein